MAEESPTWENSKDIPPTWEESKDIPTEKSSGFLSGLLGGDLGQRLGNSLATNPPQPSPGMYNQFDRFLKDVEATGRNPADNPSTMAIGGMINNLGAGLGNPEAVANAVQDVTTLGQGRRATAPLNALINEKLWGDTGDTVAKEKERQATLSEDNPYLPFAIGLPAGQIQKAIPTEGIIPEAITKPVSEQVQRLTDLLNKSKGLRALKAAWARGNEITPSELEGAGGMLEKGSAAYDEGIIGPFASKTTMRNRALEVAKRGGGKMGGILDQADEAGAAIHPTELANQMRDPLTDFNIRAPSQAGKMKTVQDILGDVKAEGITEVPLGPGGSMLEQNPIGTQARQALKGTFDEQARWNRAGDLPENAVKAAKYRQASNLVKDTINKDVTEALGPHSLEELNAARLQHGTGEEFGSLFNRAAGIGNAGGTGASIEPVTKTLLKPILGRFNQMVGYGEHVAADVTGGLANIIKQSPQVLGRFAPELQQAAARGPAALASHNWIMNQRDPEYREKIRQINGQEGQGE